MKIEDFTKEFKKNDKLAVVGTATTWKDAPFEDESFDLWGLNGLYGNFLNPECSVKTKDFDLWFDIHSMERLKQEGKPHLDFLRGCPIPLVMQDKYKEVPDCVVYPWQEILDKYRHYHESTFSWLVTLAMEMGYKVIHWYGVHLSSENEYRNQRPNLEYYIGLAEGRGIEIDLPSDADILQSRILYALGNKEELEKKFDYEAEHLQKRVNSLIQRRDHMTLQIERFRGGIDRDKFWRRILIGK